MPKLEKYLRWLALLFVLSLLAACAASRPDFDGQMPVAAQGYMGNSAPAPMAPPAPAPIAAPPPPPAPKPLARRDQAESSAAESKAKPAQQRLVHYEGSIKLIANQPNKTIEQAVEWVRAAGGYVETLYGNQVVLQIPAARFRGLYDQILGLGDVADKSLSARDVTEEFLDVDMRLTQAKATRDRLLALIQKTSDSKEKLRLLHEVERLSTDIESLESQMARLRTLVDYSRLTLTVEGRKAFAPRAVQEPQGFHWIAALAKDRQLAAGEPGFALAVPQGMVDIGSTPLWSAASPDGVTLGTMKRANEPRGNTRYWVDALQLRLKDRFAQLEQQAAGDFTVLRLQSRDEPRFVYWVAVAAKDDKLFVAQTYFPSLAHEGRFADAVLASLKRGMK